MTKLLATCPTEAKLRRPQILIYGAAGAGKTWGATSFPGVYMIDCEAGCTRQHYTKRLAENGGVYLGVDRGANDMGTVLGQIQSLTSVKHDHRTLVIDSFSKLFNTAVQVELDRMNAKWKKQGKDPPATFAAEKKPAISYTRQMIAWLDRCDMNVIFVCHERPVWKDGEQIDLTFDAWEKLGYEIDLVLQIVKKGPSRKARVRKSRLEHFEEGKLFPWEYEAFAELYGRDVMEEASKPVAPSTAEQVNEVIHLAAMARLKPATRLTWWERAGVEDWSEMDGQTLQKCIDFLKQT